MAAQALAVNGAKVYIVGRTAEKLEQVQKTYNQGSAGEIIPITADVSKKDSIKQLYDEVSKKEEHLDVSFPLFGSNLRIQCFQTSTPSPKSLIDTPLSSRSSSTTPASRPAPSRPRARAPTR